MKHRMIRLFLLALLGLLGACENADSVVEEPEEAGLEWNEGNWDEAEWQ